MYRFGLIGGGWRAAFFARVAKVLPDKFELCGSWLRNKEKCAEWARLYGGKACCSIKELTELKPDFIVVSVSYNAQTDILEELINYSVPIMMETPLGHDTENLERVKHIVGDKKELVKTAEQYLYWPMYMAWSNIKTQGLLGIIENMNMSALHGYHAVSVMRHFLDVGFQHCTLHGFRHKYDIAKTGDRSGILFGAEKSSYTRDVVSIVFENGKTVLYDFSGEQYHSLIRTRSMLIQGDRGEINWETVKYLNADNVPVKQQLERFTLGINDNNKLCLRYITLGNEVVYTNPYGDARLNDDELAVAAMLEDMGKLFNGMGGKAYSFEDSVRDAEIAAAMTRACENPFTEIVC